MYQALGYYRKYLLGKYTDGAFIIIMIIIIYSHHSGLSIFLQCEKSHFKSQGLLKEEKLKNNQKLPSALTFDLDTDIDFSETVNLRALQYYFLKSFLESHLIKMRNNE